MEEQDTDTVIDGNVREQIVRGTNCCYSQNTMFD